MAVHLAIQPYSEFLRSLHEADFEDFHSRPGAEVEDLDSFEEMRRHLVERHSGVESEYSFMGSGGEIVDCIPADQQSHLRKAGRPLTSPPDPLYEGRGDSESPGFTSGQPRTPPPPLGPDRYDRCGNQMLCPDGTIPMVRLTLDHLTEFKSLAAFLGGGRTVQRDEHGASHLFGKKWANAYDTRANAGGASSINVWSPQVFGPQSSASQQWFTSGTSGSTFQSVECGYRLGPPFSNTPTLFVFCTPDTYASLFYNDYTPGTWTYQPGATHYLGAQLASSQQGGAPVQYRMGFFFTGGNWWFNISNQWIGYYPGSLFGGGPLASGAASAGFGGEVGLAGSAAPAMGSGKLPSAGYAQAAFQEDIIIALPSGAEQAMLVPEATSANCYGIDVTNTSGTSWGTYLYFGGPGGLNC